MRKIAVTYQDGQVYHHCCQAPQLKIYTIKSDVLSKIELVDVSSDNADTMANILKEHNIKVVICGTISEYLKNLLETNLHMEVYNGVTGDADSAVVAYIAGTLDFEPNMHCEKPEHIHSCSGFGGDWNGID
ncbi:MAG: hypothetical protein E7483_06925 [Ruminococcaceae bacterium]|nr:hypothetical protein [Oscillospiraceae bacterium]